MDSAKGLLSRFPRSVLFFVCVLLSSFRAFDAVALCIRKLIMHGACAPLLRSSSMMM